MQWRRCGNERGRCSCIAARSLHRERRRSHGVKTESGSGRPSLVVRRPTMSGRSRRIIPLAYRWFRHAGGVNPCLPPTVTGRYLSFSEREDIAIWHAQKLGVREIARRLGRSPSMISRELRRNASTRTWRLEYKASTAQWHAERRARRPKPAKMATNERLARLRPGAAVGTSQRSRWSGRRSTWTEVERQGQTPPGWPPVGEGMEPRADRQAATGRLSR